MIREATEKDLDKITELMIKVYNPFFGNDFGDNYGMKLYPDGFKNATKAFINHSDCYSIIGVNEAGDVVGCIFATVLQWHLNPEEKFANFTHWCIDKDKADKRLGKQLFDKAEEWSRAKGAKLISVSLMDDFEPTKKLGVALEYFYGFQKKESVYVKGL